MHPVISLARWAVVGVYWRIVHPVWRLAQRGAKAFYWRIVHPASHFARRCVTGAYWRILYPIGVFVKRGARFSYWRIAYPILSPLQRAAHRFYWMLLWPVAKRFGGRRSPITSRHSILQYPLPPAQRDSVLVLNTLADLDALFALIPRFNLSAPLDARLHILITERFLAGPTDALRQARLLLQAGAPFRHVILHAARHADIDAISAEFQVDVDVAPNPSALRTALLDPSAPACTLSGETALRIDALGPVVLIISALWGRTGSTSIFDAQTRYFIERGCLVCRIFVDHNPTHTIAHPGRIQDFLAQNFRELRPHLFAVMARDESLEGDAALHRSRAFRRASAVGRFALALERPVGGDPALLAWARRRHALVLVNHAPHVAFARRQFGPSYILETHDVLTEQLNSHGVPRFARRLIDNARKRTREERGMWAGAQACINLSPTDHDVISRYARHARLIRPYIARKASNPRAWSDVCAANALPAKFTSREQFDLMLWGEWHDTNVDGVRWFIENVAPLDARLAHASILIVGRVTRGLSKRILNRPNIYAAGFVDDLGAFFARANVLVVPDRRGSGISIKTMEACAIGAPLAATCAGLRGLDLRNIDLTGAASAAELARDVAALLASDAERAARARIAHAIYARNFSEQAYAQAWDEVIADIRPDLAPAFARASNHACARDDKFASLIARDPSASAARAHAPSSPSTGTQP